MLQILTFTLFLFVECNILIWWDFIWQRVFKWLKLYYTFLNKGAKLSKLYAFLIAKQNQFWFESHFAVFKYWKQQKYHSCSSRFLRTNARCSFIMKLRSFDMFINILKLSLFVKIPLGVANTSDKLLCTCKLNRKSLAK